MNRRMRIRAAAGIVGPAAFTAAWTVSALRQEDYSVAFEHISGLAAPDARSPAIMTGGFLALGSSTVLFGGALEEALGGRPAAGAGPALVRVAGVALVAAGVLRRDHMRLPPIGRNPVPVPQSWRNDGHDLASAVAYGSVVAAPLALARRFRNDPAWRSFSRPAAVLAALSGALLAAFAARVVEPWNGILQRVAVTLPGLGAAVVATRLLRAGDQPGQAPRGCHQPWRGT